MHSLQFLPISKKTSLLQTSIISSYFFFISFKLLSALQVTHKELITPPLIACPSISVRTFGFSIFTCGNSGNSTSRLSPNGKACDIYSTKN